MSRSDVLELVFGHTGGVELRAVTEIGDADAVIWSSDGDADFMEEFPDILLSADNIDTVEKVINYLESQDIISEEEAETLEIYSEALDGKEVAEAEDPEDDDDGGEEDEDYVKDD